MANIETSNMPPDRTKTATGRHPQHKQWHALNILLLITCLSVFVLSFNRVVNYEDDIIRSTFTIRGALPVPVLEMRPRTHAGNLVAVIAHGFAGSKDLMTSFGDEFARAGITTYLFDFPGHGESTVKLPGGNFTTSDAQENLVALGEVVTYARLHPTQKAAPSLILLGHSMGSSAVGDYAMAHANDPDIVSTILVSPVGLEHPTPTQPKNLLLLAGSDDISDALTDIQRLFRESCNTSGTVVTTQAECGNPANGNGRRMVILPLLNHITILNASSTFQEALSWLKRTSPGDVSLGQMQANVRLFWLLCGVFAILCAMFPLSALLVDIFEVRLPARVTQNWDLVIFNACLVVGIAGAIVINYTWRPFSFVGLLLGDYLTGYFLCTALITALLFFVFKRRIPIPPLRRIMLQGIIGIALAVFLYCTLGQLVTFAWQHMTFMMQRLWRFVAVAVLIFPLFLLDEGINRGYQEHGMLRSVVGSILTKGLLVAGLFVALLITPGIGFLGIIMPVLIIIFLLLIAFSAQMYNSGKVSLAAAVLSTLLVAWCVATTFPIV